MNETAYRLSENHVGPSEVPFCAYLLSFPTQTKSRLVQNRFTDMALNIVVSRVFQRAYSTTPILWYYSSHYYCCSAVIVYRYQSKGQLEAGDSSHVRITAADSLRVYQLKAILYSTWKINGKNKPWRIAHEARHGGKEFIRQRWPQECLENVYRLMQYTAETTQEKITNRQIACVLHTLS